MLGDVSTLTAFRDAARAAFDQEPNGEFTELKLCELNSETAWTIEWTPVVPLDNAERDLIADRAWGQISNRGPKHPVIITAMNDPPRSRVYNGDVSSETVDRCVHD